MKVRNYGVVVVLGASMLMTVACGGGAGQGELKQIASEPVTLGRSEARVVAAGKCERDAGFNGPCLWDNGVIPYHIDDGTDAGRTGPTPMSARDSAVVRRSMDEWENLLASYNSDGWRYPVRFEACEPGVDCPSWYLTVRYSGNAQDGGGWGGCSIGQQGDSNDGYPRLRLPRNLSLPGDTSNMLHELGHCMGLRHFQERPDRDRWLVESVALPGAANSETYPVVGNYDYDSVMHYASRTSGCTGALRWADQRGNEFCRFDHAGVSGGDISTLLQFYARETEWNWGYFESLSTRPGNSDTMPNPYFMGTVSAVGTPAVARLNGATHMFARGSNDAIYWKAGEGPGGWTSLGCCAGSDPSAVVTGSNRLHVTFVGASSGKVIHTAYNNGSWGSWLYTQGGYPPGGLKSVNGKYLGPAIAYRGATSSIDIYAVRADGRLAVTTRAGGWEPWRTLGSGYTVSSRPAAVALSTNEVQLAFMNNSLLYEPKVAWSGTNPSVSGLGVVTGLGMSNTAPGLAKRDHSTKRYRVLVQNVHGHLAQRVEGESIWRDLGGEPAPGTGFSAVQVGRFGARIVMNGEDAKACDETCQTEPNPGAFIQPGGVWLRTFE